MQRTARHLGPAATAALLTATLLARLSAGRALLGDYYAQARKTIRIDVFDLPGRCVARVELAGDLDRAICASKLALIHRAGGTRNKNSH